MSVNKDKEVDEKFVSRSYFKEEKYGEYSQSSQSNTPMKNGKKLAEMFRTDFITAMKVPDSQQLPLGEQFTLTDTWRQEWEKGVQVPVNPDAVRKPVIRERPLSPVKDFYIMPVERIKYDEKHYMKWTDRSSTECNYDLDDVDVNWLNSVSELRTLKKVSAVDEITMERAITYFERKCFEKMAHAVATKQGLSIEYDENTTCNVCLSPDAEDGNEIIFCDACNMCVHQHCYGVLEIPEGNWLCNPCSRGVLSPPCCLCPNNGGAMKRIKDSLEWVHVICAWWIPEVKIEDAKYIERITKDKIPLKRWNLICTICKEKKGACIQCTVKRCVRAYHITCAASEGLEMKTVVVPDKDDVQHISFCSKHCTPSPQQASKKSCEDVENVRIKELRKLESEFYTLVKISTAARNLNLDKQATRRLHAYWSLRRRANGDAPLIALTLEQQEQLSGKQGVVFINQQKTLEMERFLHLRQDLERLRNLCYMIVRREKLRKAVHRASMDVFYKQTDLLMEEVEELSDDTQMLMKSKLTKFVNFSDTYRTTKQLEMDTGEKVTMFDETCDEDNPLLNSSFVEVFNPSDLSRNDVSSSSKKTKVKSKSGKQEVEKKDKCSEPERNIFSLLAPAVVGATPGDGKKTDEVDIKQTDEVENAIKSNGDSEQFDVFREIDKILVETSEKTGPDLLTNKLCDDEIAADFLKQSNLLKRGKKRFRNLHDLGVRRNSPRFNRSCSKPRFFYPPDNLPNGNINNCQQNNIASDERDPPLKITDKIPTVDTKTENRVEDDLDKKVEIIDLTSTPCAKRVTRQNSCIEVPIKNNITTKETPTKETTTNDVTSTPRVTRQNSLRENLSAQISTFINNAKRRRLNSVKSDVSSDDDVANPTDFVRVTRSRVASCS